MSSAKKGIIGAIIGVIVLVGVNIYMLSISAYDGMGFLDIVIYMLPLIPGGIFFGFGYAFGLPLGKRWVATLCGVTAEVSFWAILFSRDRGRSFFISLFIMIFVFSFALGICYIPGVFIGIRNIIRERKEMAS